MTLTNRNYDNRFYSSLNGFYVSNLTKVKHRQDMLNLLLARNDLHKYIRDAGKFAGRQPSLHIETGLLNRVTEAGLGHYVQQFDMTDKQPFIDALNKSEKLYSENPKFNGDRKLLLQAALRVFKACKFPETKFVPTSFKHAADTQINKRSSSSYPFYRRKGLVIDALIKQAEDLHTNKEMFYWPQTRGFRLQFRARNNKINLKYRVMYPYPGCIILAEDCFIIPLVKHFINTKTFYVIGKSGKEISELLREKLSHKSGIQMSDFDHFDQSVINDVIIIAFGIIRQQFTLTKEQAMLFENLVHYFCTSLMVSKVKGSPPYGFIKLHGVPSGSGFTNMIDTLVHAIMLEYFYPNILEDCLICGDDNIFSHSSYSVKEFKTNVKNIFNMELSIEKSKYAKNWNQIEFLGFTWKKGIRLVNPRLVINQMLWHTDFLTELDTYERELSRAASVLLNGQNGKDLFQKLFPDVISMLRAGVDLKFTYLFGYQPPSTLPGVISYAKVKGPRPGSANETLKLHLDKGWLIR